MFFLSVVHVVFVYVMALLAMAFFTLLERKVLGYAQLRKGPNKVGVGGLPQPLADALKLFVKEVSTPSLSNYVPFLVSPYMGLFLALVLWGLYPHSSPSYFLSFGVLLFLCVSSFNVYSCLVAGWSSNSKYSLLGAIRAAAQTISYEVSMSLIVLSPLVIFKSLDLVGILGEDSLVVFLMAPMLGLVWFTSSLAETNRTPFDFAEGESELVSGFNTEFSGGTFAAIFMAEYMNIIFMSLVTSLFFFSPVMFGGGVDVLLGGFTFFFSFLFIWVRGTLPRMRYDRLMNLTWKKFLPFSLGALMVVLGFVGLV